MRWVEINHASQVKPGAQVRYSGRSGTSYGFSRSFPRFVAAGGFVYGRLKVGGPSMCVCRLFDQSGCRDGLWTKVEQLMGKRIFAPRCLPSNRNKER